MSKWTPEETKILIDNYQMTNKEIYKLIPSKSSGGIDLKAFYLGLKKNKNFANKSKLDVLLEDTPETYYWIGYIFADGYIKNQTLKVGSNIRDKEHLIQYAKYIQTENIYEKIKKSGFAIGSKYIEVVSGDALLIPKIIKKFDFKPKKTYNPPDILPINDELLLCLLIGYIDGDGSIKKRKKSPFSSIVIEVHKNWQPWFDMVINRLEKYFLLTLPKTKYYKSEYVNWSLTNSYVYQAIKKKALEYKLPILNRKWDRIDENLISKTYRHPFIKKDVIEMYYSGISKKDISKNKNIGYRSVCKYIKEFNEKRNAND